MFSKTQVCLRDLYACKPIQADTSMYCLVTVCQPLKGDIAIETRGEIQVTPKDTIITKKDTTENVLKTGKIKIDTKK